MDDKRFLIVVGRAENPKEIYEEIHEELGDNFEVEGVHSLDSFSEVDNKDRFIIFISTTFSETEFKVKSEYLIERMRVLGFGGAAFDTMEEAIKYAEEKYDFEDDDAKRQERAMEIRKRFPRFSSEEIEQVSIFDSLYHTGKIRPMRGRYEDEEVVVLVHVTHGAEESRVTPMMIMINDDIHSKIELPIG